jgi:hypothetical protein
LSDFVLEKLYGIKHFTDDRHPVTRAIGCLFRYGFQS